MTRDPSFPKEHRKALERHVRFVPSYVDSPIETYAIAHSFQPSDLLAELERRTYEVMSVPHALSGPLVGQVLRILVRLIGAKRILEVGTFTGYGTLSMANVAGESASIVTCEIDPVCAAFAASFFARSPHGKNIELLEGDALESMRTLTPGFDLVFVDADKEGYPNYYEESVRLLRPGGCVVFDNALAHGDVITPVDARSHAIDEVNRRIATDDRVESVLITVRDGLNIVWKR